MPPLTEQSTCRITDKILPFCNVKIDVWVKPNINKLTCFCIVIWQYHKVLNTFVVSCCAVNVATSVNNQNRISLLVEKNPLQTVQSYWAILVKKNTVLTKRTINFVSQQWEFLMNFLVGHVYIGTLSATSGMAISQKCFKTVSFRIMSVLLLYNKGRT